MMVEMTVGHVDIQYSIMLIAYGGKLDLVNIPQGTYHDAGTCTCNLYLDIGG